MAVLESDYSYGEDDMIGVKRGELLIVNCEVFEYIEMYLFDIYSN